MLTINNIHSQQNLNNRKEELREEQHPIVDFSFGEWFVEKMLRIYLSVNKCVIYAIQQINVFTIIIKSIEYHEHTRS